MENLVKVVFQITHGAHEALGIQVVWNERKERNSQNTYKGYG